MTSYAEEWYLITPLKGWCVIIVLFQLWLILLLFMVNCWLLNLTSIPFGISWASLSYFFKMFCKNIIYSLTIFCIVSNCFCKLFWAFLIVFTYRYKLSASFLISISTSLGVVVSIIFISSIIFFFIWKLFNLTTKISKNLFDVV